MSRDNLERIEAAAHATVTLLMWFAMIIGFMLALAKVACATAIDCTVTTECTTIASEHVAEGLIEHTQWISEQVAVPVIDQALLDRIAAKSKANRYHCTEDGEYDAMLATVLSGVGNGNYLDPDGSTIWTPKRERITRCAPADFAGSGQGARHINHLPHYLTIGHWLRWTEQWRTIEADIQTICRTVINGPVSSPVPEPSTLLLFGAGIAGVAAVGRSRASCH